MKTVTLDHVCEALSAWTGIPPDRLRAGGIVIHDPETLRARLAEAIVGQDEAIDVAVRALARGERLGSRPAERRPLWTALFSGPSGVGKSQLAKELGRVVFGDAERHVVQIDLSDFRDEHTVARLVGAPPGYKGHGDGGELTNALRRVPTGVLLLDEVEKAHPTVLTQVLLPLLGEGAVHDMNDGRPLDASQFLIVMTSNMGSVSTASRPVGFGAEPDEELPYGLRKAIAGHFPREILGRIDDVVVFSLLSAAAAAKIWDREISSLSARLSADGAPLEIRVDAAVRDLLLQAAGARIKADGARAVRKLVDHAIADKCLELLGEVDGPGRIEVTDAGQVGIRYRVVMGVH